MGIPHMKLRRAALLLHPDLRVSPSLPKVDAGIAVSIFVSIEIR
jgi:hypothetical protein